MKNILAISFSFLFSCPLLAQSVLTPSEAALKTDPKFRACMSALTSGQWQYDSEGKAVIQAHGLWSSQYIPFDVVDGVVKPHEGTKLTTSKDSEGRDVTTVTFMHPDPVASHYLGGQASVRNPFTRPLREASVTLVQDKGRMVSMAFDRNLEPDQRTKLAQALDRDDKKALPQSAQGVAGRIGSLAAPAESRLIHTSSRFYFDSAKDGECIPSHRYDDFARMPEKTNERPLEVVAWDLKVCQRVHDHFEKCPDTSLCPKLSDQLSSVVEQAMNESGVRTLPLSVRNSTAKGASSGLLVSGHGLFAQTPIGPYVQSLLYSQKTGPLAAAQNLLAVCQSQGLGGAMNRGLGRTRVQDNTRGSGNAESASDR